jgi:hypothetical protein
MNTIDKSNSPVTGLNITKRGVKSCKKLLARIERTKNRIAQEFDASLAAHGQLVRLALNEAEALAWQTAYPHLLFPALALEKVQAVVTWQTRQLAVDRRHLVFTETI